MHDLTIVIHSDTFDKARFHKKSLFWQNPPRSLNGAKFRIKEHISFLHYQCSNKKIDLKLSVPCLAAMRTQNDDTLQFHKLVIFTN